MNQEKETHQVPPPSEAPKNRKSSTPRLWKEVKLWIRELVIAGMVCLLIVTFIVQPFKVEGSSMMPNLLNEERIMVNKLIARLGELKRGDVVVFWYPFDPSRTYVKRVIGLPGEVVEIRRGYVFINGHRLSEPYLLPPYRDDGDFKPVAVKPAHYYLLGDNRDISNDSRYFGQVPQRYILGKAIFVYWPPSEIGIIK